MFLLGRRSPRSHDSRDALNEWRWKCAAAESEKWHSPKLPQRRWVTESAGFRKTPGPSRSGAQKPTKSLGVPKTGTIRIFLAHRCGCVSAATPWTCSIPIHCALLLCFARFDCILLDIMMVRTNGVDVAVALHKAFAGSDTPLPLAPLIAMTANSSPADAEM